MIRILVGCLLAGISHCVVTVKKNIPNRITLGPNDKLQIAALDLFDITDPQSFKLETTTKDIEVIVQNSLQGLGMPTSEPSLVTPGPTVVSAIKTPYLEANSILSKLLPPGNIMAHTIDVACNDGICTMNVQYVD